jgi:hypothetical protein
VADAAVSVGLRGDGGGSEQLRHGDGPFLAGGSPRLLSVAATRGAVAKGKAPLERVERLILALRGQRVILDRDLASLYGVTTSYLNKAVSRNIERFPEDFMLQLSSDEFHDLKFQFGISSWGGTRKRPRAFTEQGVAMLSGVLHSPRAVQVNIEIMRAFVRLRDMLQANAELAKRLAALESRYDTQFKAVFEAIRELMTPPPKPPRRIGFGTAMRGPGGPAATLASAPVPSRALHALFQLA